MAANHYTGRVRAVEEYDGWAIYPEGGLTKGVQPLAKGINEGRDGGESFAKRLVDALNAFGNLDASQVKTISELVANLSDKCKEWQSENATLKMTLAGIRQTLEDNPIPGYAPIMAIIDGALNPPAPSPLGSMFAGMVDAITEGGQND